MPADTVLPLAADFAPATDTQWRALVDKVLKGADFDKRLVSRTADGLAVQPLYTHTNARGAAAHTRGAGRAGGAWDSRQIFADEDPAAANAAILEDLKGGITSITLQIAAPGSHGLDYHEPSIARALEGVLLDVCPVALNAGEYTPDCAGSLMSLWRKAGLTPDQCLGAFNYDPLGTLARTGALYQPVDRALAVAADLVRTAIPYRHVHALCADGAIWHRAGASEGQEIAGILAAVTTYLRAAERAGISPKDAIPKIAVAVAVDADQFAGMAKLRALRVCLARIADVCGAPGVSTHVTAITSERMLTRRDPWVNLLRATMACSAAAMGGADAITVLPFTWAIGRPDAFARRIARNTHIVLQEESGLGRVQDPAGGSWYVETLSSDMAAKAWAIFQDLERAGGLDAAIMSGTWQEQLAAIARQRSADVARGKVELTGTSAFPKLGDDGVKVEPWPLAVLSADLPGARAKPVASVRLAEPFERLRDAADAATERPRVFLATLGPLATHATRATWMRNYLAAAGIDAVGDAELLTSADVGRAFSASGCSVACLCGADGTYGEIGEATASLLKTAGARQVYLAGRQKDEAPLRTAGVDDFIFAGGDMVAMLTRILRDLGVDAP